MATIEERYKTPAERLDYLKGRKTKQKDLAALLGVSAGYISTVVAGEKDLKPENWLKLAEHFGVTLDWLLCREGAPKDWPTPANEKPIQLSKQAAEAVRILDSLPPRKRDEVLGVMRAMSFHVQAAALDADQATKQLTDKLAVEGVMLSPNAVASIRDELTALASGYQPDND